MTDAMPLIPTTVCGSHGLPSWLHLVREAAAADRLGPVDLHEAYDDATRLWLVPDCGLWETPRWVGISKLRSMVEEARMIRRELGVA